MAAYALPAPYARPPLRRRLSSLALALAINLGLLLILMTLGVIPPPLQRSLREITVELIPEQKSAAPTVTQRQHAQRHVEQTRPVPKLPPIILPAKPTIAQPQRSTKPTPWIEMSKEEMASSDISSLPKAGAGSGGDSEVVGKGPNGEAMYAAEWAREPTNAEVSGYVPRNAPEGFGLIACKTIPGNRVEDCVELDQTPGSRLASAVRQAAWQFHVRPPRKGGHALIGSWVRIRIDYYNSASSRSGE